MSFHALVEYIKYRRRAMSRHGVHSPFAYAFIEQVLQANNGRSFDENLAAYVPDGEIIKASIDKLPAAITSVQNTSIIILPGIHKTASSSHIWTEAIKSAKVMLSIDLYSIGLLFFREEFKEKQHFILKYRA